MKKQTKIKEPVDTEKNKDIIINVVETPRQIKKRNIIDETQLEKILDDNIIINPDITLNPIINAQIPIDTLESNLADVQTTNQGNNNVNPDNPYNPFTNRNYTSQDNYSTQTGTYRENQPMINSPSMNPDFSTSNLNSNAPSITGKRERPYESSIDDEMKKQRDRTI
jgi:hypothetical protein